MRENTKEEKMLIRKPKYQTRFYFFLGGGEVSTRFRVLASTYGASRSHSLNTTLGNTPLDEYPSRRRDLYLTTHNSHNRQTSKTPARFEPTIPPSKQPQNHVLDHAATGLGEFEISPHKIWTGLCGFTFSKIDPTSKIY